MTLGERIRERRIELGLSQDELGTKADVSKGFLSDLENGKRRVSADKLSEISRVLGLSLDYLLSGSGEKEKEDPSAQIQIPAKLVDLANLENLSFSKVVTLLQMRHQIVAHRSTSKTDDLDSFDWHKFYKSVKEFI